MDHLFMGAIGERLKDYWSRDIVSIRPGATASQIEAFEAKYGVRLPADLRDYFETVNGFDMDKTGFCDNNLFSFFPIEEVLPVNNEYWQNPDDEPYFILVDFMIASAVYAIWLEGDADSESPVFVVYPRDHPIRIASSFSEFAEGYLEGKDSILGY